MLVSVKENGNATLTLEKESSYDTVIGAVIDKGFIPLSDENGDLLFYDQTRDNYLRCENFDWTLDELYSNLKSLGSIQLLSIKNNQAKEELMAALGIEDSDIEWSV